MRFRTGMIVKSDAGRDQEQFYVIVAAEEGFAYIADGKRRKLEKPKRKNVRHLKRTHWTVLLSEVDTNPKLYRMLRSLSEEKILADTAAAAESGR